MKQGCSRCTFHAATRGTAIAHHHLVYVSHAGSTRQDAALQQRTFMSFKSLGSCRGLLGGGASSSVAAYTHNIRYVLHLRARTHTHTRAPPHAHSCIYVCVTPCVFMCVSQRSMMGGKGGMWRTSFSAPCDASTRASWQPATRQAMHSLAVPPAPPGSL